MKYFTPERFERLQSDDDDIADAAHDDWEHAAREYTDRLTILRPSFPPPLTALLDQHPLHDAELQILGRDGDRLVAVIRLEAPRGGLLILIYGLAESSQILKSVFSDRFVSSRATMIADEVDRDESTNSFEHRILLSDARLVSIRFREIQVVSATLPETAVSTADSRAIA